MVCPVVNFGLTFAASIHLQILYFPCCCLIQIGEVVDGPDDSMKRSVLDGVQYDYGQ